MLRPSPPPAPLPQPQPQVDIWRGDGADPRKVAEAAAALGGKFDFVFLDGVPKESLAYLEAAAPHLAEGAWVSRGVRGWGGGGAGEE